MKKKKARKQRIRQIDKQIEFLNSIREALIKALKMLKPGRARKLRELQTVVANTPQKKIEIFLPGKKRGKNK